MKNVIQETVRLIENGEPCVLVSVVRTKGSTPQKPGAKLLVKKDGSGIGTLGGGCVEGDIWFAAQEILRHKSGPEFKDYYLNEDIAARDGLVCGGTMYFFIEPIVNNSKFVHHAKEILTAYDGGPPVGIATIVRSSYQQDLGNKVMLRDDGTVVGSLGSQMADKLAIESIRKIMDLGNNTHLIIDDNTEIFVEGFTTPPTVVIMGGGHVGKATYDLASTLGFRTFVVDDRAEFANTTRFPMAEGTIVSDFSTGLNEIPINTNTYIVIATRGHHHDDIALESAINKDAIYVGLMGSKRKTILIYKRLLNKGYSSEKLRTIYAPIGLDLGAITPEEIAVSIISEIIMIRRGGLGKSMQMNDPELRKIIGKPAVNQWITSQ